MSEPESVTRANELARAVCEAWALPADDVEAKAAVVGPLSEGFIKAVDALSGEGGTTEP